MVKSPYPAQLPKIAIASDYDLCRKCVYVWLDPFGDEPDFNHCSPMVDDNYFPRKIMNEGELEVLSKMDLSEIVCPLYKPKR